MSVRPGLRPRPVRTLTISILAASVGVLATAAPASAEDDTREPVVVTVPTTPSRASAVRIQAGGPATPTTPTTPLTPEQFGPAMTTALTRTATTSRYLGPALSGIVIDPADGTVLWRHNDGRSRMPASAQKLLTAYTVLHSMRPDAVLTTRVYQGTGTMRGRLFLRGGGDPSLSATRIRDLAAQTARRLATQRRTSVVVHVDRSIFPAPSLPAGWKPAYLTDVQPPQGLTLAGYRRPDGALAAGRTLVAALKPYGITATLRTIAPTPAQRTEVASTSSAPVSRLVASMLNASNNDYAEFLFRHAALAGRAKPTWQGAAQHELTVLRRGGIPLGGLRVVDGTGLSRATRVPPATLAAVVRALWTTSQDQAIAFSWNAMPRSGLTGTLATRYRIPQHTCAKGQVLAKTGTLNDAVALAGVARGADGRDRVFVFLENGIVRHNTAVRLALDTLATAVVGCTLR